MVTEDAALGVVEFREEPDRGVQGPLPGRFVRETAATKSIIR
ncbi:hypothetical protein [Actinoplanes regularis]|nr:hypothetical protein [Actinoplanes regularis]